jgi:thiamine biosynthesis lipoprotein
VAEDPHPLLRHAEAVMGTVVSFAVRTFGRDREATEAVRGAVAWLHDADARFSPFRSDSEVSRIEAGTLSAEDACADLRQVHSLCDEVAGATDGYFTTRPWGRFDPSGLVKGWAVERAADVLRDHGFCHHSVAGGGDVQVHGSRAPGRHWVVGIADPHRPGKVLSTLSLTDGAVATSGTAERGAHVVDPHTGRPATGLASLTLVGHDLTRVDACATAALAMGSAGLGWVARQEGLEALVVDEAGQVAWTAGWPGTKPRRA